MARLDRSPMARPAEPHDGEVRCATCGSSDAEAAHEWCQLAGRLVCDSCCHRMLLGDMSRSMASVLFGAGPVASGGCARCERGQRWLAGEVLDAMASGELPC